VRGLEGGDMGDCGEFVKAYYGYYSQGVGYDADAWMKMEGLFRKGEKRKRGQF
jgi:hypothetical protein